MLKWQMHLWTFPAGSTPARARVSIKSSLFVLAESLLNIAKANEKNKTLSFCHPRLTTAPVCWGERKEGKQITKNCGKLRVENVHWLHGAAGAAISYGTRMLGQSPQRPFQSPVSISPPHFVPIQRALLLLLPFTSSTAGRVWAWAWAPGKMS